uniref:Movement protein n=1 Tax=Populus alba TaxID=43335 RepID=A0A4U5PSR5_POPAL|nr:hypothetical protein D5086_0000186050 [Populus alba]
MSSQTQQEEDSDFHQEVFEAEGIFAQDVTIDSNVLDQVSKTDLSLNSEDVFNSLGTIASIRNKLFKRKNHIITCVGTREYPIDIKDTRGSTEIPLVLEQEISQKLSKLPAEIRKTISYIHVGSIKVMMKSTFRVGINSPVKMAILDRRMNNPKDAIFGAVQGNLAYGKLIFTCNPKIGVPLKTENINSIICLAHEFERTNLMQSGDMPLSITYKICYSLTNSHHSMMFKNKDPISIEGIFKEFGQISRIPFQKVEPLESVWAMDLSPKPFLGAQPKLQIMGTPNSQFGLRNNREIGNRYILDLEKNQPLIRKGIPMMVNTQDSSDEDERPTVINNWTYNPKWNGESSSSQNPEALVKVRYRMRGLPPPQNDSLSAISKRINHLSLDLTDQEL